MTPLPAPTYTIDFNDGSITCLRCGRTSYHPEDVRQRYCGHCHIFHDDEQPPRPDPPVTGTP